ncbi:MAG: Rho termination factor N-terminal domain-containing protein [Nostoc sp. NMS1]|uniref:Rho termination factor N-terminal domain-containing protein n=1 Tax=unclassified Nostoc TaxID=2593658 RepID=UPI0025CF3BA9|nr:MULTISPECIES: Rho termination factor N-terminal domain-containing protein [unclassified Nostoc]MBN3906925.1 Rho termination factor N-terminal domain-containing protein [Nostoc sp. NMS1]MBN3989611.1 Rho termination factor N-terminal domain-containing protein [Nostoc sp. NMS2]
MNSAERRDRIVEYLRIKSISHGQVYTFQIAVPESEVLEVPSEKREYLRNSLTQQGTNLIPLIVRRTEAYSEEEEYEVIYGADWCLVAKELDIEKLWVWVFDMTDEQAAAAKEEMQQLLGVSDSAPVILPPASKETESTETILKQVNKLFSQIEMLNRKIEQVATSVKKTEENQSKQTVTIDQKLAQIVESIKGAIEEIYSKQKGQSYPAINPVFTQTKDYEKMSSSQLKVIASEKNIKGRSNMNKSQLITALKKADAEN